MITKMRKKELRLWAADEADKLKIELMGTPDPMDVFKQRLESCKTIPEVRTLRRAMGIEGVIWENEANARLQAWADENIPQVLNAIEDREKELKAA